MKYRIDLTINGYIEIDADSKEDAKERIEDGYSLKDFIMEDDEINDIEIME